VDSLLVLVSTAADRLLLLRFFGVPYADLTARFRHSTAKTEWPGEHWDGKKLG